MAAKSAVTMPLAGASTNAGSRSWCSGKAIGAAYVRIASQFPAPLLNISDGGAWLRHFVMTGSKTRREIRSMGRRTGFAIGRRVDLVRRVARVPFVHAVQQSKGAVKRSRLRIRHP